MLEARLLLPAALLLAAGCSARNPVAPALTPSADTDAPRTIVVQAADEARLPAPGAEDASIVPADEALLARAAALAALDPPAGSSDRAPKATTPAVVWNRLTTEFGIATKQPPPLIARWYALTQVAIYDALAEAHKHKRGLEADHATAAGAASQVLLYLFPLGSGRIADVAAAEVALDTYGSGQRAARGWALGEAVGRLVVARGKSDGSDAVFTGPMPFGDGIWTGTNPVLPRCGTWKTWCMASGSQIQPEPPYRVESQKDLADLDEVFQLSLHRTPEQIAIVHKWADLPPPTIWNGLLEGRVASRRGRALEAARAYAFLNMTMADAFICCWSTKYTYWTARPFQRLPGLVTAIPTPNFPSYTSGHSTISAAAAVIMGALFPRERDGYQAQAEEAAMSRLWGGIHFRHDNEQGLIVGHQIGLIGATAMRGIEDAEPVATR